MAPGPVEEAEVDDGRVRIGFDVDGGVGADAGASGLLFGAKLRLGWQFDRRAAACLQGSVVWWDRSETRGNGVTASGAVGAQLTPLFSFTPSDMFEIAAGPSLDPLTTLRSVSPASSGTASSRGSLVTFSGTYVGAHGRFAVLLGKGPNPRSGRRTALAIGADVHTTFVEGSVLGFFTLGVGREWY